MSDYVEFKVQVSKEDIKDYLETFYSDEEIADMDIDDEAFIELFQFFDNWEWHLDTRLSASGKDINPDVLGYIFEQYINDRAKMGAFYTQEDITDFISRNCIIPSLLNSLFESFYNS